MQNHALFSLNPCDKPFNGHIWEINDTVVPPSIESFNCKKCGIYMFARIDTTRKCYYYFFDGEIIKAPNEEMSCDFIIMNNVLK